MVALCLAMGMDTPQVLTDSLSSLRLVRGWGRWSPSRMLQCPDRVEVRMLMYFASQRSAVPRLEKVKAHNAEWLRMQHPMSVGNDAADLLAK